MGDTTNQQYNVSEVYSIKNSALPDRIKIRQWFNTSGTSCIPSGYARTFPLTFDGKKTRKQIHYVRIYVSQKETANPGYLPWNCTVRPDSSGVTYAANFGDLLDPAYISVGDYSVDTPTAAHGLGAQEQILMAPQLTGGPPLIGYTFDLQIGFPDYSTHIYRLYRVDVAWSTVGEEDP